MSELSVMNYSAADLHSDVFGEGGFKVELVRKQVTDKAGKQWHWEVILPFHSYELTRMFRDMIDDCICVSNKGKKAKVTMSLPYEEHISPWKSEDPVFDLKNASFKENGKRPLMKAFLDARLEELKAMMKLGFLWEHGGLRSGMMIQLNELAKSDDETPEIVLSHDMVQRYYQTFPADEWLFSQGIFQVLKNRLLELMEEELHEYKQRKAMFGKFLTIGIYYGQDLINELEIANRVLWIGTDESAKLRIINTDNSIMGQHARIEQRREDGIYLVDMGAIPATRVNDIEVYNREHRLTSGDRIFLGRSTRITIQIGGNRNSRW